MSTLTLLKLLEISTPLLSCHKDWAERQKGCCRILGTGNSNTKVRTKRKKNNEGGFQSEGKRILKLQHVK